MYQYIFSLFYPKNEGASSVWVHQHSITLKRPLIMYQYSYWTLSVTVCFTGLIPAYQLLELLPEGFYLGQGNKPLKQAHTGFQSLQTVFLVGSPPLAFATAPKGGSNPLEQCPSVLISYHAKASRQWLAFLLAKKWRSHH